MTEGICKVCKMAAVKGCPNTLEYPAGAAITRYVGDEIYSDTCPNMKVVALRARLQRIDPQLLSVQHDAASPLYQKGGSDLTERNLLITSTRWLTFLRHLKWVVGWKDPKFFVRVTSDAMLKQVYMGEASHRSRSPEQREDGDLPVFNSLEDLLGAPDLVVLRVGLVVYFNKAMSSILLEGLLLREGLGRPTWLVEEQAGQRFEPWARDHTGGASGMPCCDDRVFEFVGAHYAALELSKEGALVEDHGDGDVTVGPGMNVDESHVREIDDDEPPERPEPSEPSQPEVDVENQEIDIPEDIEKQIQRRPQKKQPYKPWGRSR